METKNAAKVEIRGLGDLIDMGGEGESGVEEDPQTLDCLMS